MAGVQEIQQTPFKQIDPFAHPPCWPSGEQKVPASTPPDVEELELLVVELELLLVVELELLVVELELELVVELELVLLVELVLVLLDVDVPPSAPPDAVPVEPPAPPVPEPATQLAVPVAELTAQV